uniref:Uncharacterized protein n=1 Tax=viral metagenome TaxID=1070528 RepID=A0A6C0K4R3_9ZZZZ
MPCRNFIKQSRINRLFFFVFFLKKNKNEIKKERMNLDYDLKKSLHNPDFGTLFIFVDKKKITLLQFLCLMQYEFFCAFFVSVLMDIGRDKFHDLQFPVFHKEDYAQTLELTIHFQPKEKITLPTQNNLTILERQRFVNVLINEQSLIFIPNKKVNLSNLCEMLLPENKILFQKILKIIFDKIYLILQNDPSKKCRLDYKNNFLIFILREN